jgi:hypothetical protein
MQTVWISNDLNLSQYRDQATAWKAVDSDFDPPEARVRNLRALSALLLKMLVSWDVTPCWRVLKLKPARTCKVSLLLNYRPRDSFSLHLFCCALQWWQMWLHVAIDTDSPRQSNKTTDKRDTCLAQIFMHRQRILFRITMILFISSILYVLWNVIILLGSYDSTYPVTVVAAPLVSVENIFCENFSAISNVQNI